MALPSVAVPTVSIQEQDTAAYVPWSNNAHDDPYGLISYAKSSIESRYSIWTMFWFSVLISIGAQSCYSVRKSRYFSA